MTEQEKARWVAGDYGPKTIGIGRGGGPAYFLMRPNHGDIEHLQQDAEQVVRALNLLDEHEAIIECADENFPKG